MLLYQRVALVRQGSGDAAVGVQEKQEVLAEWAEWAELVAGSPRGGE